jgi:hypothetical protein
MVFSCAFELLNHREDRRADVFGDIVRREPAELGVLMIDFRLAAPSA